MTEKYEQAEQDYMVGMKYKDIATKYDVSLNTVKSWKGRYGWQRGSTKKNAPAKPKGVHTKAKKGAHKPTPKIIDELEANNELTEKQKLFCLFYLQRFNATWAYQQAYKVGYEVARTSGARMFANVRIKEQLAELKKQQRSELLVTIDDITHEYAKQAFASLGDVLDYKVHTEYVENSKGITLEDIDGELIEKHVADIYLKPSDQIDWTLVQDIHRGKDGLVVKLYDKQKAMDNLAKLLGMDEVTKQKVRKLSADADIAEAKAHILTDKGDDTETKVSKLLDKIDETIEGAEKHDN